MSFTVDVSHRELAGGVLLFEVEGDIDVYTFPKLRDYVKERVERDEPPRHVAVDLTECIYLDSCGLGVLVGLLHLFRKVNRSGIVFVISAHEPVTKLFRITGLMNVFPLAASVEHMMQLAREADTEEPEPAES